MQEELPVKKKKNANPIDVYCGQQLRERRITLGLSQTQLASKLGITFQQIQKYERGDNRISVSRLVDLATVLDVSISTFFEKIPENILKQSPRMQSELKETATPEISKNPMNRRETLELVRVYYQIEDEKQRKMILNLCRSMAKKDDN